ncbi:MAG: ATP-binding protein [Pseudomonadota bacterium]
MFRFLEMSLHGWDLWPQVRFPLGRDVVLVIGPNGSGKTTLLDAVRQLLNARHLSSKRRLQHYLRRPDQPALIRAVVSNEAQESSPPPFHRERIVSPEATLACALVPSRAGSPEKRFTILPGRPGVDEIKKLLLDSREWLGPERYHKALENAGVSRSLMSVLAIEQGRTNSLFELSARELFLRVLDMLGDRAVLERYTEARRQYDDTRRELLHQTGALQARQVELEKVLREVRRLDEHEEARQKVEDLEARLPASELQQVLKRHRDMAPTLQALQTKVRRGEAEQVRLGEETGRAREKEASAGTLLEEASSAERAAVEERIRAERDEAQLSGEADRLEALAREADKLPERDIGEIEADAEGADRELFSAEEGLKAAEKKSGDIRRQLERLEAGLAVYPGPVMDTLEALRRQSIKTVLLAETVEVTDPGLSGAVEAALGNARYGLVVDPRHRATAAALARKNDFPGPVHTGPSLEAREAAGPLSLAPGTPAWVPAWLEGVKLETDGTWSDERGIWVADPGNRLLGEAGRRESLARARRELAAAEQALASAKLRRNEARRKRDATHGELEEQQRRLRILEEAEKLPRVLQSLEAARENAERARVRTEEAIDKRQEAGSVHAETLNALARAEEKQTSHVRLLDGERSSLSEMGEQMLGLQEQLSMLEDRVSPELRACAEKGDLDGPDTVRSDLERAVRHVSGLGDPPLPEVREEAGHLRANVEELETHVAARRREVDHAQAELDACRERYLEVISGALSDYRKRVEDVAAVAEVAIEMELPPLTNEDRVIDEARINVRFGFDGKDPLPLGDPAFSGGQQVIAGIILLMGMAEIEGRGFFMLDEPFAHLSLDRVDQVGRFLRATRSQFILTAPTTLDRSQLDPASLVLVLRKKRARERYAPVPIVAEA